MRPLTTLLVLSLGVMACRKPSPPANPDFSDALVYVFKSFEGEEADLAFAIRKLENETYIYVDVMASKTVDRSLAPERLSEEDIGSIDHPDRPVSDAVPVAVVDVSTHTPAAHQTIQLLADQTPVEPYPPTYYERTFVEGSDCWIAQTCPWLRTWNYLTKENLLMTIDYEFGKDFRLIDLNLPDPATLEEGEEAINSGEPRWAFVSRSERGGVFWPAGQLPHSSILYDRRLDLS